MRRGCVSLGEVKCDQCGRTIPYPERYLAIEEKDGVENEEGDTRHYCVPCAIEKGHAHHKMEKGEEVISFFKE
ncbi:MAG: hypothetical protein HY665_01440 [Chloroflexi bacterium]|nr:hypothetical protein [Chloroflexota bacterium]